MLGLLGFYPQSPGLTQSRPCPAVLLVQLSLQRLLHKYPSLNIPVPPPKCPLHVTKGYTSCHLKLSTSTLTCTLGEPLPAPDLAGWPLLRAVTHAKSQQTLSASPVPTHPASHGFLTFPPVPATRAVAWGTPSYPQASAAGVCSPTAARPPRTPRALARGSRTPCLSPHTSACSLG